MAFKVGDKVKYFRSPDEDAGIVLQPEGGRRDDMTEVFWKKHGQATWMKTQLLVKVGEER